MPGKYATLETYLRELPASQSEVKLSFAQVEGIIKSTLPSSAYEDERWWLREKEGNHVNARAWANAGWKAGHVEVSGKQVQPVRIRTGHLEAYFAKELPPFFERVLASSTQSTSLVMIQVRPVRFCTERVEEFT